MQAKQKKKLWIGIAIGSVISVITLGAMFVVFILLFLYGGPAEVTTDINQYEDTMTKYEHVLTGFIVFPEQVPDSAQNTDFYFSYQDTWNAPTLEVFLQCTYDEEDYQAEIARLENTQKRYGTRVSTLLRDEEGRYSYPVYIAVDGYWDSFEYAVLSGEQQITYIYTAYKRAENLKKVDVKYLPTDYNSRQEAYTGMEGYCIYLKKVDMVGDEVVGWDCDYTRDTMVEVLEHHYVTVGYNHFYATTYLDENGTEIIKECSYSYYENRHDTMYGLPDEIVYTELAGYPFKALEINEDETVATVTYYDGAEEKSYEYQIPDV